MRHTKTLALLMLLTIPATTLLAAPREQRPKHRIVQFLMRFVPSIQARITVPIGEPIAPPPTSNAPLLETP